MNMALARLIAGQIFLHACMTACVWPRRCWPCARATAPLPWGVAGAVCAHAGVSGTACGALRRPASASAARGYCGGGHGVRGRAFADFSGVLVMCLSALMTGGATGRPSLRCNAMGRAAHDTTQLRRAFSWLAIGRRCPTSSGHFCGADD